MSLVFSEVCHALRLGIALSFGIGVCFLFSGCEDELDGSQDTVTADAGGSTVVELPFCEQDIECRGGERCVDSLCREVCSADDRCVGMLPWCDLELGLCVECLSATDCPEKAICENGFCDETCESDGDCGEDEFCDGT